MRIIMGLLHLHQPYINDEKYPPTQLLLHLILYYTETRVSRKGQRKGENNICIC